VPGRAAPGEPLTHLRLTVEYDGTDFSGFQWQPAARTVAGVLEAALTRLFGGPVKLTGAGRTDSGVHASGQVVSLSTQRPFPFDRLLIALRGLLPSDLSVRAAAVVDEDFSARFRAVERTYVYAILNASEPSALLARYAWHVPARLDLGEMQQVAARLIGERDFRSFGAAASPKGSTVRSLRRLAIESRGDLVRIEVVADAFLHHMVRAIVGTLAECGTGRRSAAGIPELMARCDPSAAGCTAPARGLYLAGVRYRDGYDSFAEPPVFGG
jgi:tRNA pseudouridine38-40 synthase